MSNCARQTSEPDDGEDCERPDEPAIPLAFWIEKGVACTADLVMPAEGNRGVCRCDACRARALELDVRFVP